MRLGDNTDGVALVADAIARAGLRPGPDAAIAIDLAATQLLDGEGYALAAEGRHLSAAEMVEMVHGWCRRWPIVSIEDPLAEDDWTGWALASERLGDLQLLGDDLFTTNPSRLRRGIDDGVGNAILVKPNQNGTVSGTAAVLRQARAAGYATVVSARSGDTE